MPLPPLSASSHSKVFPSASAAVQRPGLHCKKRAKSRIVVRSSSRFSPALPNATCKPSFSTTCVPTRASLQGRASLAPCPDRPVSRCPPRSFLIGEQSSCVFCTLLVDKPVEDFVMTKLSLLDEDIQVFYIERNAY